MRRYGVACLIALAVASGTRAGAGPRATDAAVQAGLRSELSRLIDAIRDREATLPKSSRFGTGPLADARLALRKIELLRGRSLWPGDVATMRELLETARKAVARVDLKDVPGTPRVGFQERAYISEIDGSAEPFFLYVPTRYDPARPWPLLVFLHGYYSGLDVLNWRDFMYSSTLEEVCEREGVILLMPYGRSNTEFMGVGESDVLETIAHVRREYNVDPDRVILSGASMGGSGALSIACHYPDRFAGLILITARVDYYQWMGVPREALPPFKRARVDSDYARELLPNLRHVPILEFHGELDREFAAQAARLEALCERNNVPCRVVEFPGRDHYIWSSSFTHPAFLERLRSARRVRSPERFTFRTFTVKYPGAYGVRIDGLRDWGHMGEVRVNAARDGTLRLELSNCTGVTLLPSLARRAPADDWDVLLDGRAAVGIARADGAIVFSVKHEGEEDHALRKTTRLCGPIREAYDGPFVIVFPAGDLPGADADRLLALRLAAEWRAYAQATPRLLPDSAVAERHLARYNLVLCGSPQTNRVLRRLAPDLPIAITPEYYVVGQHRFPVEGNGIQFIYPNPANHDRYVLVAHGARWAPRVEPNHKLDLLPDFIVYGEDTVEDGTRFPTNRILCAGYFDGNWRLSTASTWLCGAGRRPR